MPTAQLDALEKAIDGCMDYAVSLMSWMRELVHWENARRGAQAASAALPKLATVDVGRAALTLSVLAAMFQTSIDTGTATFQPTVDLLEAIRQALDRVRD